MDTPTTIPGFLPEDYDYVPSIEEMKLDDSQLASLRRFQKETEDGNSLGEQMAATYDSYIVIGFNKDHDDKDGKRVCESVCGACHVDQGDYDAVAEVGRLLGHYAYENFEVYRILRHAYSWMESLRRKDLEPEPPEHDLLEADQRFHVNRYNRIRSEEFLKCRREFMSACGNYKKRHDMGMRMMLTAIADQLHENEAVEIDFFCNFSFGEESHGDSVSKLTVELLPYPCTWDEADAKRERFVQLCKEYNIPCHIVWLED